MYSDGMTENNTLQSEAVTTIANADFRLAWPIEVRLALVKAARTEGEFPEYAVKETKWALKEARRIETKCARDIEQGEATLSHTQRKVLTAQGWTVVDVVPS